jgi:hypothetical protein
MILESRRDMPDPSLTGFGRRRRGPLESALERALGALARQDRGNGAELADLRRALRDAALAVDLARGDALNGGSRQVLTMCLRTYQELRLAVLPIEELRRDPFDDLVADLMRAEAGDTQDTGRQD